MFVYCRYYVNFLFICFFGKDNKLLHNRQRRQISSGSRSQNLTFFFCLSTLLIEIFITKFQSNIIEIECNFPPFLPIRPEWKFKKVTSFSLAMGRMSFSSFYQNRKFDLKLLKWNVKLIFYISANCSLTVLLICRQREKSSYTSVSHSVSKNLINSRLCRFIIIEKRFIPE